jgi:hypothetical protein
MKVLLLILPLLLGACGSAKPNLIRNQTVVFIPDERFFYCPTIEQFPDVSTLTDEQIASLLTTLDTFNRDCKISIDALRTQLITAQTNLENR